MFSTGRAVGALSFSLIFLLLKSGPRNDYNAPGESCVNFVVFNTICFLCTTYPERPRDWALRRLSILSSVIRPEGVVLNPIHRRIAPVEKISNPPQSGLSG
jgi:hypothetical protein